MNERPTFSPFWHRVRTMKPRLRPHVQITRQHYRGRRWHVVHDPTSNQFYRLNPVANDFIGTLDGTRDVETAWKVSLAKFGDASPTQNEIIQLISQLYSANLLSADSTPETEQLLRRGRERIKKKITSQAIGIMYLKIRLFNPDRLLTAAEPVFRPIINAVGFAVWLAVVAYAFVWHVLPNWEKAELAFDQVMDPGNLFLIPISFAVLKAVHEFGHGVICKRYGGQVPEFGVMLLVLFPSPYVDASSTWAFPSKWRRMAVGAGGMIFELFVAALCAIYWAWAVRNGEGESTLAKLAFNAMVTASVSTVLFNANPLMRFDGYYILADLLEVPNLSQRSMKMLQHLAQKYIYRLRNLIPPTTLSGERATLIGYGLLSLAYRVFLFVSITLYVMGQFFGLGLVLAVWTAAAWFVIPVAKFVHWNAASPQNSEHRGRAVAISLGLVALGCVLIGVIPFPDYRRGAGVVESERRSGVFFGSDGFVQAAHRRPGEVVKAGEPLVTLANPDFAHQRAGIVAQLEQSRVQERDAIAQGQAAAAILMRGRGDVLVEQLGELDRRIAELVVLAPHDGTVAGDDPERLVGAFVKRGDPACEVVDTTRLRIAATMDQRQGSWLFGAEGDTATAKVRLASNVGHEPLVGANPRVIDSAQKRLPSPALSYVGGGSFEADPQDQSGQIAKRPQFLLYLDAAPAPDATDQSPLTALASPGERVKVRFRLEDKPLLSQWIDRLQKEIQGRVKL